MHKMMAAVVSLMVVGASLLVAAPAGSATPPWRAVVTFDKFWKSPSHSRLIWQLQQRQAGGAWKTVETRSWRAGSGMLGRAGVNSCAKGRGWLPNGTYSMRQHNNYPGNLIKGRAFRIDDKTCPNGTRRVNLFIHTEQGPGSRQCRNRRGDQLCRWEVPRHNDYKSAGCIKMAPRDLAQLVSLYQRHFSANVRYSKDRVVLRVVN